MDWAEQPDRSCAGMPIDFFADDDRTQRVAAPKATCNGCPVRAHCLQWALDNDERWGVWGALTTLERDRLKYGGMPVRVCSNCGLLFVSSRKRCQSCSQPIHKTVNAFLMSRAERIRSLVEEGLDDARVAEAMAEELGQAISPAQVRYVRGRIGASLAAKRDRLVAMSNAGVDHAEITGTGYQELTHRERVELLRRWLALGKSITAFCRTYHLNGTSANDLQSELDGVA